VPSAGGAVPVRGGRRHVRLRIVILSVLYSIEISPILKALAADATQRGAAVTFVTDELSRDSGALVVPGVAVRCLRLGWSRVVLGMHVLHRHRSGRLALRGFRRVDRLVMRVRLKRQLRGIHLCFVAEYHSLALAIEAGLRPESTVYLSFEGSDNCAEKRDLRVARQALPMCRAVCVASPERGDGLRTELSLPDIQFIYLPVSWRKCQTRPRLARKQDAGQVRLVYSGYLAPWAQIKELLEAFAVASRGNPWTLTIHGHSMGTGGYRDAILGVAAGHGNVSIDEAYYDDERYVELLSQFDIGVALYTKSGGGSNWGNLSLSSGKIAGYCQAGLAIITNLDDGLAQTEPFLHVTGVDGPSLARAVRTYVAQPDVYKLSSLRLFEAAYDATPHLQRLWAALGILERVQS
jgi:hypothetical protein